jgi:Bacterial Ig domain/Repeat of unknown function (DUF5648)
MRLQIPTSFTRARRLFAGLLFLSIAAAASVAGATSVGFVGSVGYSTNGISVIMVADQIHNADSKTSAALRLELWATPAPFAGSFASGYAVGQYSLGTLAAGASLTNVSSGAITFTSPPGGSWYVSMVLTENTGAATNGGFTPIDHLNFPDKMIGKGPPPPPPTDTVPPTASISSPTAGNVSGTVMVSASASDNVGVTRVDFYLNGLLVGSDSTAPYQFSWNTTSQANGAATLRAVAFDAAGNSGQSPLVSVMVSNITPDTTPPTISIASPTGGNVSGMVSIMTNASDNVGVTRVDMYVNNAMVASASGAPWQFSWNSTSVPNGSAILRAVAFDAAGNSGTSANVSIMVGNPTAPPGPPIDPTPPTATITSPTGGSVSGMVAISVNASDNIGVTRVDFYANASLVGSIHGAPWQFSWNSTSVANGVAKLKAIAYDASGNSGTSPVVAVTVANSIKGPPPPSESTANAIEFYAASLDHYFISASQPEIDALDTGKIPGWARTGNMFKVYAQAVAVASPVCRIYIPPLYGDSHFFSASPTECSDVIAKYPFFDYEAGDVFYIDTPDAATGACPNGDAPVYRLWNNRADTNHRYTTSQSLRNEMVAKGYVAEGYGPDAVIMCSPP